MTLIYLRRICLKYFCNCLRASKKCSLPDRPRVVLSNYAAVIKILVLLNGLIYGLLQESGENNLFKTTAKVTVTSYFERMNTTPSFTVVQPTFPPAKEVSEVPISPQIKRK